MRRPSKESLMRLGQELVAMQKDPLPGALVCSDSEIATMVHAIVIGPPATPYEGGFFHFLLDVPDNYPHRPPRVCLLTTGNGTVRFNPQLYSSGKVCLSILHTWAGPSWNPSFTLQQVLLQIQALLNDMPALNEPGVMLMDPTEYNAFLTHETLRVAVLGVVQEAVELVRHERLANSRLTKTPEPPKESQNYMIQRQLSSARRLPVFLAKPVLHYFMEEVASFEDKTRKLAMAVPDGSELPGRPNTVRAQYLAMGGDLRRLRANVADELVRGSSEDSSRIPGYAPQVKVIAKDNEPQQSPEGWWPNEHEGLDPHAADAGVAAEEVQDEPECRICGREREDTEMLRPCSCAGSMAHVHRACAAEWVKRTGSPICPTCRKAYTDPALRALGRQGRCRRRCAVITALLQLLLVLAACVLFDIATGAWYAGSDRFMPLEIDPGQLGKFSIYPARTNSNDAKEPFPAYRVMQRSLQPVKKRQERWNSPMVEKLQLRVQTSWSEQSLPVSVSLKELVSKVSNSPASLDQVLRRWHKDLLSRQVKGRGRGIQSAPPSAEPLPTVVIYVRPPDAARFATAIVLFAWLAIGKRPMIWMAMCCEVGCRFTNVLVVGLLTVVGNIMGHQVQRWLAWNNMFRRRQWWEGDSMLLALLVIGSLCASDQVVSFRVPWLATVPAHFVTIASWVALLVVVSCAVFTVAKPPGTRRDCRARLAVVLHGLLWLTVGAGIVVLGAMPLPLRMALDQVLGR